MSLGLKGNVTMSDFSASLTSLCQSFKRATPKPIRIKTNSDQKLLPVAVPDHRLAFRRHCCI
jgi:hypothetical protein